MKGLNLNILNASQVGSLCNFICRCKACSGGFSTLFVGAENTGFTVQTWLTLFSLEFTAKQEAMAVFCRDLFYLLTGRGWLRNWLCLLYRTWSFLGSEMKNCKFSQNRQWSRMEKHAKLLGQFSPEAHFSKMIHTGKKSISLSLDELSVLSVGFTRKQWGREEGVCTLDHTHTCARVRARTHTHMTTQPSLQILCSQWN